MTTLQRPRKPVSAWRVIALVAVAVIVVALVVGGLFATKTQPLASESPAPAAAAPTSLPDLGGPRSQLVPEMTLPVGARPYEGEHLTPQGFEFWEVPGTQRELVAKMRSALPTFAPLNGMPWCGELIDTMTSWAWGSEADTIGVSLIDGGVMIRRLPEPQGCRP
jgi:hypothetical protein